MAATKDSKAFPLGSCLAVRITGLMRAVLDMLLKQRMIGASFSATVWMIHKARTGTAGRPDVLHEEHCSLKTASNNNLSHSLKNVS